MQKGAMIKRKQIRNLVLFVVALIAINLLLSTVTYRLDLTRDKRFTLSTPTRTLLKQIKDPVRIKVFLKGTELPAEFRHFAYATRAMLEDFRHYAGGYLQFEFINPLAGLPDSAKSRTIDSLARMGIRPYNVKAQQNAADGVSIQLLFPAALIDYKGHKLGINLLQPQPGTSPEQALNHSTALLEYNFAHAIAMLAKGQPPKVAYLLGHGEPLDPSVYDALTLMDRNYRFDTLNLKTTAAIPKDYQAVVMMAPTEAFTRADKLKLDQYLMQGGTFLWALHSVQANMDSLRQAPSFLAFDRELNLADQLFTYGLRVNPDIVQDMQCFSIPVTVGHIGDRPQIKRLPWVYEPLLDPSAQHAITNNLDRVWSDFPGSIDTVRAAGIHKTTLLRTSAHTRSIATPVRISLEDVKTQPDPRTFVKSHLSIAVLLEGRFSSAFKSRLNATELSQVRMQSGAAYRPESKPTKMIVVSDPNIFRNGISKQDGPLPMGMDTYTRQLFANRDFFENCLAYLTDTTGVMVARNKEYTLSLLDQAKVESQQNRWKILNFLVPFLFVLCFGMVFQYVRKRKYSR